MNKQKKTLNTFEERNNALAKVLESGKYNQAKRRLRWEKAFCCLGLSCEVFRVETGEGHWDGNVFFLNGDRCLVYPPLEVANWFGWAGLRNITNPDITIEKETMDAGDFNDNGTSFKEIAKGFRALAKSFK